MAVSKQNVANELIGFTRLKMRLLIVLFPALLAILLCASGADIARAQQEARTFANPVMRGVRLDWCKHWGRECGKPAADLFCKESGFERAKTFRIAKGVGRTGVTTLVFGDGRVCNAPTCDGFGSITCVKAVARGQQQAAPGTRTLQTPIRRGDELTIKPLPIKPIQPSRPSGPRTLDRQGQGATIQRIPGVQIQPSRPRTPDRQGQGESLTIQRIPVRPPAQPPGTRSPRTPDRQGQGATVQRIPMAPIETPQKGGGGFRVDVRNICMTAPEACCPNPQRATLCKALAETLLDIQIRSYVPPRFTVMDEVYSIQLAPKKIVSGITKGRPYNVRPGCRFSPTVMRNKIRDEMNVFQQMGELFTAWTSQWNSGLRSAKSFIANNIAKAICGSARTSRVPVRDNCEDKIASHTRTGIDAWMASMGIPPEFPDINQLRDHGIQYLAAEATSYAIGEADILLQKLDELPIDAATKEDLYEKLYNRTYETIRDELDKITPTVDAKHDNPLTWGHLDPAFAPHNAHVYLVINVKPRMEAAYRRLFRRSPKHKWPPLYLHDLNDVYQDVGPIDIPKVIPAGGLVVPIELRPATGPTSSRDRAATQIPGTPISNAWLQNKFGLLTNDNGKPTSNVLTSQRNYLYTSSANWFGSEYDLFYATRGAYKFRLLQAFGAEGPVHWADGLSNRTGSVWDAQTGIGVRTGAKWDRTQNVKRYYGLIEPAPRCDGQPAKVIY